MPGRPFGEYEVLARIATGGAANIFLARHPSAPDDRKLVCLKTLLPERASDRDFVDMFLDEARIASRLKHENCVQLYNFGKSELTYYLAMEYIFGETLWGLLTTVAEIRRPLPPAIVASIIASACDGLHSAHELKDESGAPYNIVHRDISPQNIMVTFDGRVKVLDFGIAKAETGRQATQTGIVKGKFSYMSPEQITGGAIDRRSDLYSVGIVMFECIASRRLYRADSPEEIARMMLGRRPPNLSELMSDIDPELDRICAKALSREAKTRFQSAAEFSDALKSYLKAAKVPHGPEIVAKLNEERFKDRIAQRKGIYRQLLDGNFDEDEMLSTFNARPVLELDFQPAFSPEDTLGDSKEEQKLPLQFEGADAAGDGWNLHVSAVRDNFLESLELKAVPEMYVPRDTGHGALGSVEEEARTLFEPASPSFEGGSSTDPDAAHVNEHTEEQKPEVPPPSRSVPEPEFSEHSIPSAKPTFSEEESTLSPWDDGAADDHTAPEEASVVKDGLLSRAVIQDGVSEVEPETVATTAQGKVDGAFVSEQGFGLAATLDSETRRALDESQAPRPEPQPVPPSNVVVSPGMLDPNEELAPLLSEADPSDSTLPPDPGLAASGVVRRASNGSALGSQPPRSAPMPGRFSSDAPSVVGLKVTPGTPMEAPPQPPSLMPPRPVLTPAHTPVPNPVSSARPFSGAPGSQLPRSSPPSQAPNWSGRAEGSQYSLGVVLSALMVGIALGMLLGFALAAV